MGQMVKRMQSNTGEVEWYTPARYLEAAAKVMGLIDLDPCSSWEAQQHVKAADYFTAEQDGLQQRWWGRVFVNPPYAMPHVRNFVDKLVASYIEGDIEQAILLVNNATDTQWFHHAAKHSSRLCFTYGRIRFLEPFMGRLEERPAPMVGQVFLYFGQKGSAFARVFVDIGLVLRR